MDYSILRGINLTDVLRRIRNHGLEDESIDNMYVYALSNGSDHMFELFDDRVV